MSCNHSFRNNNPIKILRALFNEQCKVESQPQDVGDFITMRSRDLFNAAGLPITDTAKYSIATKLSISGLLSVYSDPDHKQAFRYALTPQGIRCLQCHRYNEGIEPVPEDFKCGPVTTDF